MTATLDSLGPYRIVGQIGQGGMATVYKGYQPGLDREVAVKVLPTFLAADDEARERFRREARTVAHLRHPNILTIFDFGEENGLPYLVCELVEGGTLNNRLGGRLAPHEAVELLRPVAAALDYAHERGVLHRDVKPSNVLLTADGVPVLADFGIAKMLSQHADATDAGGTESRNTLTEPGTMQGTPEYMAPEHTTGEPLGPAVDIYSLAVMAYEMLTGQVPYSGVTPMAVLIAQATAPLPSPRSINPDISEGVEAALLKGLAKRPQERPASAGAFVDAVSTAADAAVVASTPTVPTSIVIRPEDATAATDPANTAVAAPVRRSHRPLLIGGVSAAAALAIALGAVMAVQPALLAGSATAAAAPTVVSAISTPSVALPTVSPTAIPATPTAAPAAQAAAPPAPATADAAWAALAGDLDANWSVDWVKTIALIDAYRAEYPGYQPAIAKLYAALLSYGQQRVSQGDRADGIAQLERARSLLPGRPEAVDALRALTPTAVPRTATATARPAQPTTAPTRAPTTAPTAAPTRAATSAPAAAPTTAPTTAPTRAPTAAPSATPAPTATAAPGTVLLADNFDDPSKGVVPTVVAANASAASRTYENGAYVIRRPAATVGQVIATLPGTYRDVTLSLDARIVDDVQNRVISASCRTTRVGTNYAEYEFRMYPSPGTAELRRRDAGEAGAIRVTYTSLVGVKTYPAIKRGNETNHVDMTCTGDTILVAINGQQVIATRDGTYAEGSLSFSLTTDSAVPMAAAFENLVVTQR